MDIELSTPLRADQIEFRVLTINKGGYANITPYKDARCDMQRLDDVYGCCGWQRRHLNGNANCVVSVYSVALSEWVGKEDTGTASNTEAAKGLASDSFKRACFNWGIGRELYDYPLISLKLNAEEFKVEGDKAKATWKLKMKEWTWFNQFKDGHLNYLACKDQDGNMRYAFGTYDKERKDV
jgi:hypothetical protein